MTKQERQRLRKAIQQITSDDQFDEGLEDLCRLADMCWPAASALRNCQTVDAIKLMRKLSARTEER